MRGGVLYIDGASRGNPGPAGVGVKIIYGDKNKESIRSLSKYIGETTNNIAEYMALIFGLQEALALGVQEVLVYSDSELLTKQLNKEYKIRDVRLKQMNLQVEQLVSHFVKFTIRHSSREENRDADRLANKAISNEAISYGARSERKL